MCIRDRVLIWHNLVKPLGGVFGIYELLPAFILAGVALVVVSLLTAPPSDKVLYEFDHYMDNQDQLEAGEDGDGAAQKACLLYTSRCV